MRNAWIRIVEYNTINRDQTGKPVENQSDEMKSENTSQSRNILQHIEPIPSTKCEDTMQHNSNDVKERRTYTDDEIVQKELSRLARTIHSCHQQRKRKLCSICQQYKKHVALTLKNYETL